MTDIAQLQPAPRPEFGSAWAVALAILALVAVAWFAYRWLRAEKELAAERRRAISWTEQERANRAARWHPDFSTRSLEDDELAIRLLRVAISPSGRRVLNSLEIGSVTVGAEGWEKAMDALVVTARARMAELNAFIDSYSDPAP